MWVCESETLPGIKWSSSYDMSRTFPEPISCRRLEKPFPIGGPTQYATWWKIARMIESLPF